MFPNDVRTAKYSDAEFNGFWGFAALVSFMVWLCSIVALCAPWMLSMNIFTMASDSGFNVVLVVLLVWIALVCSYALVRVWYVMRGRDERPWAGVVRIHSSNILVASLTLALFAIKYEDYEFQSGFNATIATLILSFCAASSALMASNSKLTLVAKKHQPKMQPPRPSAANNQPQRPVTGPKPSSQNQNPVQIIINNHSQSPVNISMAENKSEIPVATPVVV